MRGTGTDMHAHAYLCYRSLCHAWEPSSNPIHQRTSGDIGPEFSKVMGNLHSTVRFLGDPPLSRPGAFAYPDSE